MFAELSGLNLSYLHRLSQPDVSDVKLMQSADLCYREIRDTLAQAFILPIEREDYLLLAQQLLRIGTQSEDCRLLIQMAKVKISSLGALASQIYALYSLVHPCILVFEECTKPVFQMKLESAYRECRRLRRQFRKQEEIYAKEETPLGTTFSTGLLVYNRLYNLFITIENLLFTLEHILIKNS